MLWNLIAKNPFASLREHMKKTQVCVSKTKCLFEALFEEDKEKVSCLAKEISQIEHECDLIKQEVRIRTAKSIFLPIERRDLLQVISYMDKIADGAEDLGVLLTMRWMSLPAELHEDFWHFFKKTFKVVDESAKVIFALDRLIEAGFSGPDAEEVVARISHIDRLEHEADKAQDQLGKHIFEMEESFSAASLVMWIKIIEKIGHLANCSEKMMNHIRLMLVIK